MWSIEWCYIYTLSDKLSYLKSEYCLLLYIKYIIEIYSIVFDIVCYFKFQLFIRSYNILLN